jgi:hypothetical protein
MTALLVGYAVAIAIVFFASRPISINGPRTRPIERRMAKADQPVRLLPFLLLGYIALTAAEAFAFTFVW